MPPGPVTVTPTVPLPAGATATIWVFVTLVIVPGVEPNVTAVAPEKCCPVIVTTVPASAGPEAGLSAVIAGGEMTTSALKSSLYSVLVVPV
jgi:hypothetical protein